MWWRRASRLKTARSSRAASTSAKRAQREQRPTDEERHSESNVAVTTGSCRAVLSLDGRGRASPHKLPSPHERAHGSLLVAVVSAASPAKGADLFLRRSAGNSERNNQSPAATAAAQVKEPSARARRSARRLPSSEMVRMTS